LNGNSFRLNWDQPQGSREVTGFNIYRDGSYITTVQTAEYVEPRIDWGRDYDYRVVAIDNTVKFSDPSAPLTVNTANGNLSQANNDNQNQNPQPAQIQNDAGTNTRSSSVPDGYRMIFSDEFRGVITRLASMVSTSISQRKERLTGCYHALPTNPICPVR